MADAPTSAYDYIPASIAAKIPALGDTSEQSNPVAHIKLFSLGTSWSWYIIEYDPSTGICYGLVVGLQTEFGLFSLPEIVRVRGRGGLCLPIERDLSFEATPVLELLDCPKWFKKFKNGS